MKKAFLVLAAGLFSALGLMAQESNKSLQMAGGLRASLPIGDFSNSHSFGIGAEVQAEYMTSEKFALVASGSYSAFMGKSMTIGTNKIKVKTISFIPVLVGARAYPTSNIFIGLKGGLAILSGSGTSSSGFSYEPQVGYNTGSIQLALGYNGYTRGGSTLSQVGLSALYKF